MKSTVILVLTILVALSSYSFGGETKKVKVEGVVQALDNADYKKLFQLMPFDLLPLYEDQRAVEVRRLSIIRDDRNAPIGFTWSSRDGSFRVRLLKLSGVGLFNFKKQDAAEEHAHSYLLRAVNKGWVYKKLKHNK